MDGSLYDPKSLREALNNKFVDKSWDVAVTVNNMTSDR